MGTLYVNDELYAEYYSRYDEPKQKMQDVLKAHIEREAAESRGA